MYYHLYLFGLPRTSELLLEWNASDLGSHSKTEMVFNIQVNQTEENKIVWSVSVFPKNKILELLPELKPNQIFYRHIQLFHTHNSSRLVFLEVPKHVHAVWSNMVVFIALQTRKIKVSSLVSVAHLWIMRFAWKGPRFIFLTSLAGGSHTGDSRKIFNCDQHDLSSDLHSAMNLTG